MGLRREKKQKEIGELRNKLPKLTAYFVSNQPNKNDSSEGSKLDETPRTSLNTENENPNCEKIVEDPDVDSHNDSNVFNVLYQDEIKSRVPVTEVDGNNTIGIYKINLLFEYSMH